MLAGRERGLLLLEGERLVFEGLAAGHKSGSASSLELELLLVSEQRPELAQQLASGPAAHRLQLVEGSLLDRVSALKSSPGVLALFRVPRSRTLADLEIGPSSLLLVVAGLADPGNLGALARSAEAAGAQALVVVEGGVSPWNEKALRGSMGSLLRLPIVRVPGARELGRDLEERGVHQLVAATRAGAGLWEFPWRGPAALWVGGETGALPDVCHGFDRVTIPMAGAVESLNVTVAASLILYTAGHALGSSALGSGVEG